MAHPPPLVRRLIGAVLIALGGPLPPSASDPVSGAAWDGRYWSVTPDEATELKVGTV